jgi:N-acetylneuraminic acid mutarotase
MVLLIDIPILQLLKEETMKKALVFVLCVGLLPMLLAAVNMDKINTGPEQPRETKELPEPFFPNVSVRSTGGPDDFGYTWIDSDEPGGPVFNWIEISTTGTPTNLGDDATYWGIPFTFTFYGMTFDTIGIGSNGAVLFDSVYWTLSNYSLPSSYPNTDTFIIPYWDDLNPAHANSDDVYWQIIGNQLVIEWNNICHYGTPYNDTLKFEVILDGTNGNIIFQYLDVSSEAGSGATVGIQGSPTAPPAWYLQYSYNTISLHDNLAIKFSAAPGVLYVDDDDDPSLSGYFETSFSNLGIDYDIWVVTDSGDVTPSAAVMGEYAAVVWTTGEDYASTFVGTDTIEIGNYLNAGGKLWLSSEDVLWNLGTLRPSWLHVASYTSDIGCDTANGIGPIMTGTSFATDGGVVYDYSDLIAGDAYTWAEMENQDLDDNTIAMDVTTGLPYYLFFQSFPFENIDAEADRDTMMQRVMTWLLTSFHDVGTNAIVEPSTDILPASTVDPTATYANNGTFTETFDVYFTIDSAGVSVYYETANITLDAGDDTTIIWPSWTAGPAPSIVYDVAAYTDLAYDENNANDTLTQQTTTAAWTTWQPISLPGANMDRLTHATVYDPDGDMIYMIGGNPSGTSGLNLNYNYSYDPNTNTWNTSLASMPTSRGWIQGAYWDGKIYVIGGLNNSSAAITTNEIYDITANSWSTGAPLPVPDLAHGTVAWNGNIYVVGGWDGVSTSGRTSVYRYDIAGNAWSTATSLPMEFDMGGVTIWDDVIYICGGVRRSTSSAYTHVYSGTIDGGNPDNITWVQLDPLPTPNSINGATAMDGKIYMLGGFLNLTTGTNQFWEYDPAMNNWTQLDNYVVTVARNHMLIARRGHNEIYAIAGDADCNWAVPNREYNKIAKWTPGVNEQPGDEALAAFGFAPMVNPTKNQAVISYTVSNPGMVSLKVYDRTGRLVQTLVNAPQNAGTQTVTWDARNLSNGVYFLRLEADNQSAVHKLVLVK